MYHLGLGLLDGVNLGVDGIESGLHIGIVKLGHGEVGEAPYLVLVLERLEIQTILFRLGHPQKQLMGFLSRALPV